MAHASMTRGTVAVLLVLAFAAGCAASEDEPGASPTEDPTAVAQDLPLEAQMRDAILAGDPGLAEALIDAGLDIEAQIALGLPPLHYALQLDRDDIVQILLEAGADLESRDSQGRTPLMVAASFSDADTIQVLLDAGADPFAVNPVAIEATPLIYAATWNNVPAIEALLDAGVDIDAVDLGNSTALLYAAQGGRLEAVICLLEHGADPSIRDTDHESTARDWAEFNGFEEIVDAIDAATR